MKAIPPPPPVSVRALTMASGTQVYFAGPPLEEGPLPALLYFSLSGEESLTLDPYNQPVAYLQGLPLRIFSLTLPAHGEGFDKTQSIKYWAHAYSVGDDLLSDFFAVVETAIDHLFSIGVIQEESLAVGGLSRGAFVGTHVAARDERVRFVLGFAPLTDLAFSEHFAALKDDPRIAALALKQLTNQLTGVHLRFYMGNRDSLVSTRLCFDFIEALAEAQYQERIRSPRVELVISPSIGHKGHGTAPHIFHAGARWLEECLLGENKR